MSRNRHIIENILVSGFLREHEECIDIRIPKLVEHAIGTFCKQCDVRQLGLSQQYTSKTENILTFKSIINNDEIIDIQCGSQHTLCLTSSGNVYGFGCNESGQLGLASNIHSVNIPQLIPFQSKIKSIACGALHSLFIDENGKLLCCGYNYCGQLGTKCGSNPLSVRSDTVSTENRFLYPQSALSTDNDDSDSYDDCDIDMNDKFDFIDISDDEETDGDDGFDDTKYCCVYQPIFNPYFDGLNIRFINIYCGSYHSLCITTNGECYTFGDNYFGNLGNGTCSEYGNGVNIPYKLDINKKFVDGSCGNNHNILITEENEIIVFGDNTNNQCSIMNTNKIKHPFILSKEKEFGISEDCEIEKVICNNNKSLFIIDIYKRNI